MRSVQKQQRALRPSVQTSSSFYAFFVSILAICLPQGSLGFQTVSLISTQSTSTQNSPLYATVIDPVEVSSMLASAQHAVDLPLSALLSSTIVAPSADALAQLHGAATTSAIPMVKAATTSAIPLVKAASTTATAGIQDMLPGAGDAIKSQAQQAANDGWQFLDASKFIHGGQASMPGFSETKSVLAPHVRLGAMEESVTLKEMPDYAFASQLALTGKALRTFLKIPYTVLAYVFIEFFFLRSDVDLYKEDIEDDPSGVFAETVSDTGVRLAIFFLLAGFTIFIS